MLSNLRRYSDETIGSTDTRGLHHLVYEVVDNSIDEALAGTCDRIEITINADNSVTVAGEIDGIVVAVPFREGRQLAAGELIAQLDDDELAAQVARAEAVRNQQRSNYERTREVVEQRAGARPVAALARQLLAHISEPITLAERELVVTASIGISHGRRKRLRSSASWTPTVGWPPITVSTADRQ